MSKEDRVKELERKQDEIIKGLKAIMSNTQDEKLKSELEKVIRIGIYRQSP